MMMVRRRSPRRFDGRLPKGWFAHEGGPCPVHPDSNPHIILRAGTKTNGFHAASHWTNENQDQDFWHWKGMREQPTDIIGYWPDPLWEEGEAGR